MFIGDKMIVYHTNLIKNKEKKICIGYLLKPARRVINCCHHCDNQKKSIFLSFPSLFFNISYFIINKKKLLEVMVDDIHVYVVFKNKINFEELYYLLLSNIWKDGEV